MASDYLTLEEACKALNKSDDEVKALVAGGQLSEIRDGDNIYYKRTEVEQISAKEAKEGSSIVDLVATEDDGGQTEEAESFASALSSLADSSSGLDLAGETPAEETPADSGVVEAAPVEIAPEEDDAAAPAELTLEDIPEDLPAAPAELDEIDLMPADEPPVAEGEPAVVVPEVPDLGLSGSSLLGLEAGAEEKIPEAEPAVDEAAPADKKVGISVFDDDELEIESDPMGETQITSSVGDFDAVGSGSGLLDLTRESDDTSLGAELLDVISPTEAAEAAETMEEADAVDAVEADPLEDSAAPVAEEAVEEEAFEPAATEMAPAAPRVAAASMAATGTVPLNVCALLGILGLAFLGLAAVAQIQGVWPEFMNAVATGIIHYAVFGGMALIAIATGVIGILAGRGK